jgi:hypothetical protein
MIAVAQANTLKLIAVIWFIFLMKKEESINLMGEIRKPCNAEY